MQLINVPTHTMGNIPDLLFSNYPGLISNIKVNPTHSTTSDHHLITFHLAISHLRTPAIPPQFKWNYSKTDLNGLQDYLLNSELDACLELDNVKSIWKHIRNLIYSAHQLFVPVVRVPRSPSPKWFNEDIRHMIKKSHSLRRRYKCKPTITSSAGYRTQSRTCKISFPLQNQSTFITWSLPTIPVQVNCLVICITSLSLLLQHIQSFTNPSQLLIHYRRQNCLTTTSILYSLLLTLLFPHLIDDQLL